MKIEGLPKLPHGTVEDLDESGLFTRVDHLFDGLFQIPLLLTKAVFLTYIGAEPDEKSAVNLGAIVRRAAELFHEGINQPAFSYAVPVTPIGRKEPEFKEFFVYVMADIEDEAFVTISSTEDLERSLSEYGAPGAN